MRNRLAAGVPNTALVSPKTWPTPANSFYPIKPVGHLIRTSGFAYDIELLVAVHRRGFKIAEMPVEVVFVRDKGANRIGMKDCVRAFVDTWAIFARVYFKHYYD